MLVSFYGDLPWQWRDPPPLPPCGGRSPRNTPRRGRRRSAGGGNAWVVSEGKLQNQTIYQRYDPFPLPVSKIQLVVDFFFRIIYLKCSLSEVHVYRCAHEEAHVEDSLAHTASALHQPAVLGVLREVVGKEKNQDCFIFHLSKKWSKSFQFLFIRERGGDQSTEWKFPFISFLLWWLPLSGYFSLVSSPIIFSSSSESSNLKSKAASPRASTSGNCLLGGLSLFLRHAMWIQWIHLPCTQAVTHRNFLFCSSNLPAIVEILRNFHPYCIIQLFVVLSYHRLLT